MNIWILTSEFPPEFGGGIGMYVDKASQMFANYGHDVTVIVRDTKKTETTYVKENLKIHRFLHQQGEYYSHLGYWAALSYQYAEEVVSLISNSDKKPDIIEVQDYNAIGYYLLLRKWQLDPVLKDIPVVVHLHTPTFELDKVNQAPRYKFPNYWIGQMEKFTMLAADGLLSPSQFLKDQIQYVAPNNEIKVINLPYYVERYESGYERNFDSDTILYFGRTEYRKGVVQLLQGVDKVWSMGFDFKLKIIGGDTYFHPRATKLGEYLKKKYSHRIEEGKLIFKDAIPPEDLNPEILNAKAVVIPSLYENYPYTCVSSMWLGSPMLVSKSGGQSEMVGDDSSSGYVFDWKIEGDFEENLIRLLKDDKEHLIEMSQASHKRIRGFCDVQKNIEKRISYFQMVIANFEKGKRTEFPTLLNVEKPQGNKIESEPSMLSIIVPYYNLGNHIEETINSALSIDYPNYEIVIIDDGSTDQQSLDVLNKFKSNDSIRIITIENAGLANARNVGALNARGEYITFLDADDLIDKNYYSQAIALLNRYSNVSYVYSWLKYFDKSTGIWPTFNIEFPYFLGANMLAAFAIVRREDFINFGMNKKDMEYGLEDYEGWLSMSMNGCVGISIPKPLVQYRVRTDSMSRQFNRNMILYLRDKMSQMNSDIYNQYGDELYRLLDANGPGYLWNNPTFDYPNIGYQGSEVESANISSINEQKYELMRLANSKWGSRLIKVLLKLKINKLFR